MTEDLNWVIFPTVEALKPLAALVIDRANIAPGSTGIIDGFGEDVDEPERFSLPECPLPEDPEEGTCGADLW